MTTAFDAMLELARRLGATFEGDLYRATSEGTDTSLISTTLDQADGYWNGGILFIKSGVFAGMSREVTGFTGTTHKVEVAREFDPSTRVPNGSEFAITKGDYPHHAFVRALNAALRWWGDILYYDDTALDTAPSTLEYSLPPAAVNDLRNVMIATSGSWPYNFQPFPYWYVNKGSGKLVFRVQPRQPYDVGLIYVAPHGAIGQDADQIDAQVHLEALYQYAMAELYLWKVQSTGHDDRKFIDFYNQALQLAEKYKHENRRPLPGKDPSYAYDAPLGGHSSWH